MILKEQEIDIPPYKGGDSLLGYFEGAVAKRVGGKGIPIRFAVTESGPKGYHCELGILEGLDDGSIVQQSSIFEFVRREVENSSEFNAVMIVPTGIGAEIGGHAGDAAPAARLLAGACDTLITHPNVVNASDINELPENGLYIEGSVLSNLLMGTVGLERVRANRVMLVIDRHKDERITELYVDAASAARASLGAECPLVVEMEEPIRMIPEYSSSGRAVGQVEGLERLCEVLHRHRGEYDAVALATLVEVPDEMMVEYFRSHGEIINPWGGVEAMLTHAVTMLFGIPAAHSPMLESMEVLNIRLGLVDPRMSAEAVSMCFLHCVLKGLHRSPRIITDRMVFAHPGILTGADVSCVVIPDGCVGLPTLAALEQGIPVIAVRENRNQMRNNLEELGFASGKLFIVENYLEAAGVMTALRTGVAVPSVRRPLAETEVSREGSKRRLAAKIGGLTASKKKPGSKAKGKYSGVGA
ncbi:MAG: DUF3326 domain-containing protein [Planctomycetota bacterium]|nr:MAG: DUF3326 domain-containing protein [Planctomycetota bacterium]